MSKKNSDRFITTYQQGMISCVQVLVDKMTGVNYLFTTSGHCGGLTVLLDQNGKPVITPVEEEQ